MDVLKGFTKTTTIPNQGDAEKSAKSLEEIEIADINWRLTARKWYGAIFITLLLLQNAIVFTLFINAYTSHKLEEFATVLTIVLNGTLIETAYIIRIIVKWLFSDINYKKTT